jgi:hypothetical protein
LGGTFQTLSRQSAGTSQTEPWELVMGCQPDQLDQASTFSNLYLSGTFFLLGHLPTVAAGVKEDVADLKSAKLKSAAKLLID